MNQEYMIPVRQMIRACRRFPDLMKLADSTGQEWNGRDSLLKMLVLRRFLRKILGPDERNVGLLFPTSVYGAAVNGALALDRRVAVNLNYTFGQETLNYCILKAKIKHVLTTKRFLERFPDLKLEAELIVLEDAVGRLSALDKILGLIESKLPISILEWKLGLTSVDPNDPIAIIFTSGSTGVPKGVMLSHRNIAANLAGFRDHLRVDEKDRVYGILPIFHAFGYATNIWIALSTGVSGVYHFNPLDPKKVGEVARKYQPTIMPSTATFQRNYLRRCPKEDFASVKTVVCGAEKVPLDLMQAWEEKFGNPLTEGYGATELSPVVSANVDRNRRDDYEKWNRAGSVGRPFFNLQAKIVDLETGKDLPPNSPGMLKIKGPSVMLGYYEEPEKTMQVLSDGWYTTGDIAKIDEQGFIWITGRESRMSKIGGEMVPHILIEEIIARVMNEGIDLTQDSEETGIPLAVTGLPDERKGERIIVLYTNLRGVSPEEICKRMQREGIPNLWIPLPQHFRQIESIPVLGTGKLDLRTVREIAKKEFPQ